MCDRLTHTHAHSASAHEHELDRARVRVRLSPLERCVDEIAFAHGIWNDGKGVSGCFTECVA